MNPFPSGAGISRLTVPFNGVKITSYGYNNFHYIAPQRHPWIQDQYTLHFVLHGSGTLEIGGKKHPISKQQLFAIPPNEPMMYYPNPDDKWDYVWFCFSGTDAAELFHNLGASIHTPILNTENGSQIEETLALLFSETDSPDAYMVNAIFYQVLHYILQPKPKQTKLVRTLIDQNFQSVDFTIEKLCKECGLSHSQLCRIFSENYGTSPKQYLIQKRLNYAKQLLRETNLKIEAIARSSGYLDSANFMKEFKKKVGMSAGQFRKHAKRPVS